MTKDTSGSQTDRRREILKAAVEVFAERGFHRTRVSDIAKKAGVAYGLIYHYFDSKEAVLDYIFRENWGLLVNVLRDLNADTSGAADKLTAISDALVEALILVPRVIQVILQEIFRSERFAQEEVFREAFSQLETLLRDGQQAGEISPTLDPKVAAYAYFGALEATCTGVMLGTLSCATPDEADYLKTSLRTVILTGLKA